MPPEFDALLRRGLDLQTSCTGGSIAARLRILPSETATASIAAVRLGMTVAHVRMAVGCQGKRVTSEIDWRDLEAPYVAWRNERNAFQELLDAHTIDRTTLDPDRIAEAVRNLDRALQQFMWTVRTQTAVRRHLKQPGRMG